MTNQELLADLQGKFFLNEICRDMVSIKRNDLIKEEIEELVKEHDSLCATLNELESSFWLRLKFLFTGKV